MEGADPRENEALRLRLLIASEVRFLCECLSEILCRDNTMSVTGCGYDCNDIVRMSHDLQPDMVLLDAALPGGIAAARQLRETMADVRVVVFAVSESVDSVLRWAEAGIAGYIPSTAALADMHALVVEISAGRQTCAAAVSAGLLRHVAAGHSRLPAAESALPVLTPREAEIVHLLSTGLSNKEISRRLNIGVATTKSHVHNVLSKLKLQRRGQAACWAHARTPQLGYSITSPSLGA